MSGRRRRGRGRLRRLAAHAVLLLACAAVLAPLLWVVDLALRPGAGLGGGPVFDPRLWTLDNLRALTGSRDAAGQPLFWRQFANSLGVAAASAVLGTSLASSAAYALSRFSFPGRRAGLGFLFAVQMFPGVLAAVPIYILLDAAGLIDSLLGLVLVYASTALPFAIWMLKGFFDQVPRELEEAARVDGAGPWQAFARVALPLVRPGLMVTVLFCFMGAWNEFILAATFLHAEPRYTLPVVLQQQVGAYGARWELFAAGALVVSLPVVVLFYALQRHLVGGLTAGALKG
ncbi:MAG: cyclodextrin transporter permease [Planctomycetota bacterium]|nr:MAG: cyclodextrin transporter permease [Planctomycetota bacterium]